jgi:Protein of unknown function (DUF1176)
MMRILTACLVSTVLTAPASAQVKQIRDWLAACDNTRACSAFALKDAGTFAYLRIDRDGAPAAAPRITVVIDMAKGRRVTLAFDDPGLDGLPKQAIAPVGNDELTKVEVAAIEPFLAALRKATKIVVKPAEPKGDDDPIEISLSGASAALLWIDEQQKRLGTVTALVRRGDKPESAVPPPPAAPAVTAAKAAGAKPPKAIPPALLAKGKSICGADDPKPEAGEPDRLSGNLVLYRFNCRAMSGAYNAWSGLMIAPRDKPDAARVVRLPYPPGEAAIDGIAKHLVVNAGFNEETMTLSMFGKSRGPGDCGTSGEWVWDGTEFRLAAFRSMPKCAGVLSDDWPLIYRAQVRPQ